MVCTQREIEKVSSVPDFPITWTTLMISILFPQLEAILGVSGDGEPLEKRRRRSKRRRVGATGGIITREFCESLLWRIEVEGSEQPTGCGQTPT